MCLPLLDIVGQGNVPLQMSLAEMRNLGFQFEPLPQQSCLNCAKTRNVEIATQNAKGNSCSHGFPRHGLEEKQILM